MATANYMVGRKKYTRPQAIAWSNNPGTLSGGIYIPTGQEVGASAELTTGGINQFLILSDHNRSELSFTPNRIEQKQRMINGNMRSYHIADKNTLSFNWTNLPSRAFSDPADFDANGASSMENTQNSYTVDGGAGAVELLDWYETHKGSFWMFLAYDKYNNFGKTSESMDHLVEYNQIVEVYFSNFTYDVVKRGRANHDLWNVSVTLEEA
jgi:hypothetical protein